MGAEELKEMLFWPREEYTKFSETMMAYHVVDDDDYAEEIRQDLEQELDALVRHELYAKYKTASIAE